MSRKIKSEIRQMNLQLIIWAYEYYEMDNPTVSDAQYDGLYNTYLEMVLKHKYEPNGSMLLHTGVPTLMMYNTAKQYIRKEE